MFLKEISFASANSHLRSLSGKLLGLPKKANPPPAQLLTWTGLALMFPWPNLVIAVLILLIQK